MIKKSKAENFYLYSTDVENFFISDFMIKAEGDYVKAYLLGLMYANLGEPVDSDSIRRQLNFSAEEMQSCWAYWEEQGVIKRDEYDIEFLNLREMINPAAVSLPREESVLDDKELAKLYKDIQIATGRTLSLNEMKEITVWLSDYAMSPELILFCYSYCVEKGRSNSYRYVGAILKDWHKKEIKTKEEAARLLNESDSRFSMYKQIFSELGFSRNPTAEEKRLMNAWLDEYKFSLNDIINACKETAGISSPNLRYVDAVLKNKKGNAKDTKRENIAALVTKYYEKLRASNEAKVRETRAKIFAEYPRVKDILKELGEESLKQSKALLRRDSYALTEAKEKITKLLLEKKEILLKAGYEENATDAIYTCSKCKDTGVLEDGSTCSCYGEILERINGKK